MGTCRFTVELSPVKVRQKGQVLNLAAFLTTASAWLCGSEFSGLGAGLCSGGPKEPWVGALLLFTKWSIGPGLLLLCLNDSVTGKESPGGRLGAALYSAGPKKY